MIISIDGRCLERKRTGTGRYLINLLKFWRKENNCQFKLYFKEKIPQDEILKSDNFELKLLKNPLKFQSNFFFEHFLLPRTIKQDKANIFFSPYYLLPFYCPTKSVVALHDISYEAHPEWFSFKNQFFLRLMSKAAARRSDTIVTVSEFSKKEIMKFYRINSDKITVTLLAADDIFSRKETICRDGFQTRPYGNKFILAVGSIFNRRHIPELIKAFKKTAQEFPELQLLIIGVNHTQPFIDIDEIIKKINERLNRRAIVHKNYVSENDLVALYNAAQLSVYLSDYEGFGLPLLESMACGTPVITSRKTSLIEVGGEAAIFIDSYKPDDIYDKIKKVLADSDFREERIKIGFDNLKKFNWEKCARETMDVFKNTSF